MFGLEILQANSVVVFVFRCNRNDESKRGNGFLKDVNAEEMLFYRKQCCSIAHRKHC